MSTHIDSVDDGRVSFDVSGESDITTDPVCGAAVDRHDDSTVSTQHVGATYYFCSEACQRRFHQEPSA
jgi:YHS domain-containing protein